MSSLALPIPDNLRIPDGRGRTHLVESDVYNICERMREIDRSLFLWVLDPPITFAGMTYNFSVTELCEDGQMRLVKRFEELDARILKDLEYMLHVPFEQRIKVAEKIEEEHAAASKAQQLDELYERIGRPMLTQLEHDGFSQRSVSYPKGRRPRRSR